jgi:hypothetical protein
MLVYRRVQSGNGAFSIAMGDHLRVAPMGCDTINRHRIGALLNGVLTVQTKAGGQYYVNLHFLSDVTVLELEV